MHDDERPTPDIGYPVQPDPRLGSVNRRAVPVYVAPERSRRNRPSTDEIDPVLTHAFEALLRRKLRWLWRLIGGALIAAGGALLTVLLKMLDAREQSGVDKQRMRYVEDELRFLRSQMFRAGPLSMRDQPDPAPWMPAAPMTPPAQKDLP